MATIKPASQVAAQPQMQTLPMTALASPYDGTNPAGAGMATGMPIMGLPNGSAVPQLTGLGSGGHPQVNATNQTALAPNGNVNQTVTNSNSYTNKYYNIVVPQQGGLFGGIGGAFSGAGNLFGSWNTPGNSFVDPKTGVLYVQEQKGFMGWLKGLFRGY
ncbi:MAG: hypothetical protein JWL76_689 [Thermoleophilia bacterium]|nr:hypothetical protein [Thermoleophilia bacterium]